MKYCNLVNSEPSLSALSAPPTNFSPQTSIGFLFLASKSTSRASLHSNPWRGRYRETHIACGFPAEGLTRTVERVLVTVFFRFGIGCVGRGEQSNELIQRLYQTVDVSRVALSVGGPEIVAPTLLLDRAVTRTYLCTMALSNCD